MGDFMRWLSLLLILAACGKDANAPPPPQAATVTMQASMVGSDCHWTWNARVNFTGTVAYELYAPGAEGAPTKSGTFQKSVTETGVLLNATGFFYQWYLSSGAWRDSSSGDLQEC
jgi:hypothetical protein